MEYFITIISCNRKQIWYKMANKIQGGTFSWIKKQTKNKNKQKKQQKVVSYKFNVLGCCS